MHNMRHRKNTLLIAGATAATLLLAACGGNGDSSGNGGAAAGGGEGKTMRLALNQTEEHPSYIALDNFGTYLEENTDGWSIDVFPNETRSEEHTSELQSRGQLVCRLL